jgi:hypothetical protein
MITFKYGPASNPVNADKATITDYKKLSISFE